MGIELAKAFVTIRADSANVGGDLENVRAEVDNTMKDIAAGATALLAPLAGFGRRILGEGIAMAKSYEQTTVEMETMLGSAEETRSVLERLTKFAVETPFEMPQLLNSVRGLITFGDRGDDVFDTLKVLGDASGGSAEKFGLLSLVFNQVRGVGKLLTQDFRQMSTRGIISLQDIAKHYKVTTAAAQGMLSSGKVSFADFKKILTGLTEEGGRFANGMLKQSTTLAGLTSTFSDAINITKRMIAEPLVPWMKAFYSAGIAAANAMSDFVKNGGEATSMAFVGATAFAAMGTAIFGATFAAHLFGITLKKALIGSGVGILIVAMGALAGWLISVLKPLENISAGWKRITGGIFGVNKAMKDLGLAWNNIKRAASLTFTAILDAARPMFDLLKSKIGITAESFSTSLNLMIMKVAEWALEMSEWAVAVAKHWEDIWAKFPQFVAVAFSYAIDIALNAAANILHAFMNIGPEIAKSFAKTFMEIAKMFKNFATSVAKGSVGVAKLIVSGGKDGLGLLGKEFAVDFAKNIANPPGIFEQSDRTRRLIEKMGVSKTLDDIQATKDALREGRRKTMGNLIPTPGGFIPADMIKGGATKPTDELAGPVSKAGMFQIEELGKNLQKNMLDEKKNPAHQTNALLEDGMEIQKKQLKANEKIAEKIGAGMGE